MKHTPQIVVLLLGMFFITQLIGIAVIDAYSPEIQKVVTETGEIKEIEVYNLPYGTNPPQDTTPKQTLLSIIIAFTIAIVLIFALMRINAELFLRLWFFFVVTLALGITFNAVLLGFMNSSLIAILFALPLAFIKIFKRNIILHNLTELLIYPGIAAIFVPLLSIWTVVLLLILISFYDIYAVWHAGFMQKMAQYQIKKLRFFAGFFVPYLGKKQKETIRKAQKSKKFKDKKIRVSVGILGGGDVVFPIILAGVVFKTLGLAQALLISIGATAALAFLFYISKKGKFYPAMPFITTGCFIGLGIAFLI